MLMTAEGLFVDDEAYKKAYTDALGVACKSLGFGADIYRGRNDTKYSGQTATATKPSEKEVTVSACAPALPEQPKELPELSPEHPRWNAFISWAAKKPKDKRSHEEDLFSHLPLLPACRVSAFPTSSIASCSLLK